MLAQIEGDSEGHSRRTEPGISYQTASALNQSTRGSVNDGNIGHRTGEQSQTSINMVDHHHDPSADLVHVMDNPYTDTTNLFSDYEWYGLSLAEAGIEELSGFEPSNLFQQGWRLFS